MGEIIAVTNQKGGVGKTTTSINLGTYLANQGRTTVIVDLDPQANATLGLGVGLEAKTPTVYEVITGEVLAEKAVLSTAHDGLGIVASTPNLAGAAIEMMNKPYREYRLRRALRTIKDKVDFVLIDCPPSLGLLTINGLVAADKLLVPVQCEYLAVEGLKQLLDTIKLVRKHLNPKLQVLGALLTMYDKRTAMSRKIVKEVRQNFPGHVFESVIPRNTELAEAPSMGQSILTYAGHSRGAKAYEFLSDELLNLY